MTRQGAVRPCGRPVHRLRSRRLRVWTGAAIAGALLAGCAGWLPNPAETPELVEPLSKVYVQNASSEGHYVRMNWPDGFVQVSLVDAGTTLGLQGAIGTSAFPMTIDVLSEACELVASLDGLPDGRAGIVVINTGRASLHGLDRADASWDTVGSTQACGATRTD